MKSFMEIGLRVFDKSGRQTHTDRQTRQLYKVGMLALGGWFISFSKVKVSQYPPFLC